MIQTIRVSSTNPKEDLRGKGLLSDLKNSSVTNVRTVRLYRLEGVDTSKAKILAEKLFAEKINQDYSINSEIASLFNKQLAKTVPSIVEIAYKPGVMNPEVASIMKAAKDLGINLSAADSSTEYYFFGIDKKQAKDIVSKLKLFNPIIEYIVEQIPTTLKISGKTGTTKIIPLRKMTDEELLGLSKDKLFLNLEEMKVIQDYFKKIKRDPSDVELETLAQTWSEHCAHKTFKARLIVDGKEKSPLFARLKKEALKHDKNIVSAFVDNSGVMSFYDGFSICGKVETHNSPSAIEPYGGATTGSGGVFRDVLGTGQGAKNIASTDIFCVANPDLPSSELPEGCLPPDYLLKRVVTGVRDYGNRMGIPTNNGSVHFHDDFRAKPSVIVGAYGLIPTERAQKGTAQKGDVVVVVGGKTGRDGIHGATFSSAEMSHETININSSAVQIGNAIEEKRMFDAILEARDADIIRAMQDCGAGGFSSAIGEMGSDIGVTVDLSKAPLKYQGLSPWEIWVSESQERMALAIPKTKVGKFMQICKKYNVEAVELGHFDGSGKLNIFFGKEKVSDLSMDFLYKGLPQRTMVARKTQNSKLKTQTKSLKIKNSDIVSVFKKVLANGNVNSKEPIVRLYDHTVQGTNAMQPFVGEFLDGPADAAIVKPILGKPYGMVISHGLNPILNNIDPYEGSIWAAVEALSNYVAVGGDYHDASLINNYIWPFPDAESLWSLDQSVDAVVDVMKIFKTPVISGKDSLSSTYRGKDGSVIKIPPALCISVFGKIADVTKTATSDFKKVGSTILLVGKQDLTTMGGSVLSQELGNDENSVPKSDLKTLPGVFDSVNKGIVSGAILSCHDVSEGGLATSVFEMCVGGNMGSTIEVPKDIDAANFLFNETAGCFVVELDNSSVAEKLFKNIPYKTLGKTAKENKLVFEQNKKTILSSSISELKKVWQEPMETLFP